MNKTSITDAMRRAMHREPAQLSGPCWVCKRTLTMGSMLLELDGAKRYICARCLQGLPEVRSKTPELTPAKPLARVLMPEQGQDSGQAPAGGLKPKRVSFTIWGVPVPKPRMTAGDKANYRPCVRRYWEWKAKAVAASQGLCGSDHCVLEVRVYLPFPKSFGKHKRELLYGQPNRGRGDADNFLKAAADSLFSQDCGLWRMSVEKRWQDERGPCMEITVS